MQPQLRTDPLSYTLHGLSVPHDPSKSYAQEFLATLGRVWPIIKAGNIPNDGLNRAVYDGDSSVFAGLVLGAGWQAIPEAARLERKEIQLTRYAVWKHVGPYRLLPATGDAMTKALASMGLRTGWPMIEVYGHWTNDESKLETETFVVIL